MYNVVFKTEVALEVQEAYNWYYEIEENLAERFLSVLDSFYDVIIKNPAQYQIIHKNKRSVFIKDFLYQIIYSIFESDVVVFSVFHTKRNPKIWKKRK